MGARSKDDFSHFLHNTHFVKPQQFFPTSGVFLSSKIRGRGKRGARKWLEKLVLHFQTPHPPRSPRPLVRSKLNGVSLRIVTEFVIKLIVRIPPVPPLSLSLSAADYPHTSLSLAHSLDMCHAHPPHARTMRKGERKWPPGRRFRML